MKKPLLSLLVVSLIFSASLFLIPSASAQTSDQNTQALQQLIQTLQQLIQVLQTQLAAIIANNGNNNNALDVNIHSQNTWPTAATHDGTDLQPLRSSAYFYTFTHP